MLGAPGASRDESQRPAAWVARVQRRHEGDRHVAHRELPADVAPALLGGGYAEHGNVLDRPDHLSTAGQGDGDSIRRVVAVRVRHQDGVGPVLRRIPLPSRRLGILGQERIDHDDGPARRLDLECRMSEIGHLKTGALCGRRR